MRLHCSSDGYNCVSGSVTLLCVYEEAHLLLSHGTEHMLQPPSNVRENVMSCGSKYVVLYALVCFFFLFPL